MGGREVFLVSAWTAAASAAAVAMLALVAEAPWLDFLGADPGALIASYPDTYSLGAGLGLLLQRLLFVPHS